VVGSTCHGASHLSKGCRWVASGNEADHILNTSETERIGRSGLSNPVSRHEASVLNGALDGPIGKTGITKRVFVVDELAA